MDSATLAEKISRDPLFDPKTMGLRTTEVRELRCTSPTPPTSLNFRPYNDPSLPVGKGTGHMYRSSINISSVPQQQPLRQHNKRFSASTMALHSNHMYSSSKASPTSILRSPQPIQDRSRSLKNLASTSCKSLDRDDRAMLNWLSGVVGYKISDYSMLYDGTVLCQLINTIKSNTINIDYYRDRSPAEKLQIAFYSMKEHLNINGPPAHIESIIEGNEDDLLFTYLQKIQLFYCTSYTAPSSSSNSGSAKSPNRKYGGSTKSLNRSHSLNTADKKHPLEYRTQTSSPYPTLHTNSSCTNLESITENKVMEKVLKQRPHSYHELSTVHLTSSSGARVIAVESGSSSEAEFEDNQVESGIPDDVASNSEIFANSDGNVAARSNPRSKVPSNLSLSSSCPAAPIASILKNSAATTDISNPASSDIASVESSSNASEDTKSRESVGSLDGRRQSFGSMDHRRQSTGSVDSRKHSANVTPVVTPSRHQVPPLPNKAPPPLPPGTKRSLMEAMESTDSQTSLQSYLNQVKKENAEPCEVCIETKNEAKSILKQDRELVIGAMKKALESEKRKRIKLERRYKRAVTFAQRTVRHYEKCIDDLSEKIASLTTEVQSHHKTIDSTISELAKELSATKDEVTNMVPMTPPVSTAQDIAVTESHDDTAQSRKTFRLFRKTSKKKVSREKGDIKTTQSTSLKSFPQKDYFEHVESLNIFLQKLGYTHLLEKFMAQDIGLKELVFMDESHLANIGIPMGPRLRILHELQTLSVYV